MAETFVKFDNANIRVTTTKLIPKEDLLAQKKALELRITDLCIQLKETNQKLKILGVK